MYESSYCDEPVCQILFHRHRHSTKHAKGWLCFYSRFQRLSLNCANPWCSIPFPFGGKPLLRLSNTHPFTITNKNNLTDTTEKFLLFCFHFIYLYTFFQYTKKFWTHCLYLRYRSLRTYQELTHNAVKFMVV